MTSLEPPPEMTSLEPPPWIPYIRGGWVRESCACVRARVPVRVCGRSRRPRRAAPAIGDRRIRASRPTTLVWALLHNRDADAIRSCVAAGRHADARGLLLNRAVELISLVTATPALPASRAA